MKELNPIDEVQYRMDCRRTLKDIGFWEGLQMLYTMLHCAEILTEELLEEKKKME